MKDIRLYKPSVANDKISQVYMVDIRGNQCIKDYLDVNILVDGKQYTIKEWLGKLACQVEFQQRDYERKIKELEDKFKVELDKQKEINKNLLNAIREGGTI